jgi:hypothetical protein
MEKLSVGLGFFFFLSFDLGASLSACARSHNVSYADDALLTLKAEASNRLDGAAADAHARSWRAVRCAIGAISERRR